MPIGLVPVQALQRTVPQHPGRRQWPPGCHPQLWCAAQGRGPPLGVAASPHRAPYHRPFPGSQGCGASQPARSYEKSQPASHACERAIVQIACKFEYSMQKICDAGCWLEIAYDPASQPASSSPPGNGLPPQLDGGWPPPPAAAPDPELRTIVGDGYQAATAAVPDAGAPFFAVLGLVPGRYILKMEQRTVHVITVIHDCNNSWIRRRC